MKISNKSYPKKTQKVTENNYLQRNIMGNKFSRKKFSKWIQILITQNKYLIKNKEKKRDQLELQALSVTLFLNIFQYHVDLIIHISLPHN